MTAYLGRDTVCGLPVSVARAGVGVSQSPWCLSGDTLDSDHGRSCLHHHLLAEIQIITYVLMWVVVLICGQSHWGMKGTAAVAHGVAHVFQDEDGEGARRGDELTLDERRCVENSLFTAAAISLCYFWVFQIIIIIKTYLILAPRQITPLWVSFYHLTVFYCIDCHKKIIKKEDEHNVPLRATQARLVKWTSFWSRWWTKMLMEDGRRQIGPFCWEKSSIHPSPSACWQNRSSGE